jgi:signal transduction histidine kinase
LPYIGLLVVGLFILIGYFGFKHIKDSEQRSVWIGMARETAHQLGTPLSSLLGWMELLKEGKKDETLFSEMERDINRLEKVAARFSQIGSDVKLTSAKIIPIVQESVNYYRTRIPRMGKKFILQEEYRLDPETMVNPYLLGWVIENLIRNGIDAIAEEGGVVTVIVHRIKNQVVIDVSDTGCGIEPHNRRNIFRPGYTTKSRGWGVGLSLARRIIQDYHGGKLFLKETRLHQGTTIRILLPLKK